MDSIQYANNCDRFVTGSKDGSARIWRFERQTWKCIVLNMAEKLPSDVAGRSANDDKRKYTVTMVEWTLDDNFVVTAVNDCTLKIWNSDTGKLVNVLKVVLYIIFDFSERVYLWELSHSTIQFNPLVTKMQLHCACLWGHGYQVHFLTLKDSKFVLASWLYIQRMKGNNRRFVY